MASRSRRAARAAPVESERVLDTTVSRNEREEPSERRQVEEVLHVMPDDEVDDVDEADDAAAAANTTDAAAASTSGRDSRTGFSTADLEALEREGEEQISQILQRYQASIAELKQQLHCRLEQVPDEVLEMSMGEYLERFKISAEELLIINPIKAAAGHEQLQGLLGASSAAAAAASQEPGTAAWKRDRKAATAAIAAAATGAAGQATPGPLVATAGAAGGLSGVMSSSHGHGMAGLMLPPPSGLAGFLTPQIAFGKPSILVASAGPNRAPSQGEMIFSSKGSPLGVILNGMVTPSIGGGMGAKA